MPKTRELSNDERSQVVGAWKCGVKVVEISKRLNIPDSTVRSIIKKFEKENLIESKVRSGRPKKLLEGMLMH